MARIDAISQQNPYLYKIMGEGQNNLQSVKPEEMNSEAGAVTGALTAAASMGAGPVGASVGAAAGASFGALTSHGVGEAKPVGTSNIFQAQSNEQGSGYKTPMQNYNNGLSAYNVLPEDATKMFIA